jgi:hypothetical protein
MLVIRVILPALAVSLVLFALCVTGRGFEAVQDPVILTATVLFLGISFIPMLRRAFLMAQGEELPPGSVPRMLRGETTAFRYRRYLLPLLVIVLALGCLLVTGVDLKVLRDRGGAIFVAISTLIFVAGCLCPLVPFLLAPASKLCEPSSPRFRPVESFCLTLLLIWNSFGVPFIAYGVLGTLFSFKLPDPPSWCASVLFFWFLLLPITTFGVTMMSCRRSGAKTSRLLVTYSLAIFVLWAILFLTFMAFVVEQGKCC